MINCLNTNCVLFKDETCLREELGLDISLNSEGHCVDFLKASHRKETVDDSDVRLGAIAQSYGEED